MKTIQLPKKALHPTYAYGAFEFYTSQKDYDNGHDKRIELPQWMVKAIDEYAKNVATVAVETHLAEVRKTLGIS